MPLCEEGREAFPVGRVGQLIAEVSLEPIIPDSLVVEVKATRHRRHSCCLEVLFKAAARRRAARRQTRRHPAAAPVRRPQRCRSRPDRTPRLTRTGCPRCRRGESATDMSPGLTMRRAVPRTNPVQRVSARAIDPGKSKDMRRERHGRSARPATAASAADPAGASRASWAKVGVFINPRAVAIAVDASRRQQRCPLQTASLRPCSPPTTRSRDHHARRWDRAHDDALRPRESIGDKRVLARKQPWQQYLWLRVRLLGSPTCRSPTTDQSARDNRCASAAATYPIPRQRSLFVMRCAPGLPLVPHTRHRVSPWCWSANCSYVGRSASRAIAHTAIARTKGDTSARRSITQGNKARSPLLPMAIKTLRTKRARPVRLIGDLRNRARKDSSSSRTSDSQRRRRQCRARTQLDVAGGLGETIPRAHREAIVASVDTVAHQRPQRTIDVPFVLDREVRDAAARVQL